MGSKFFDKWSEESINKGLFDIKDASYYYVVTGKNCVVLCYRNGRTTSTETILLSSEVAKDLGAQLIASANKSREEEK